ncbi:S-methyl-5'-thioinosine phosphorylase [hydrothermal vent metagenome]|uniref:S-methyl-5'-thioinosine phosphorylase n=1 Tax=hydrothermal vent metagenome TaxID=652676 RepID=A0A3B1BUJ4_9ZZZZ
MRGIAIIGGTGLTSLPGLTISEEKIVATPFGETSAALIKGQLNEQQVLFLARHGSGHTIPPHKVNYRANIWALKEAGAYYMLAINAVGGINPSLKPAQLVIPDQIIDYTSGREMTCFDGDDSSVLSARGVVHVDFSEPYCPLLRRNLLEAARKNGIELASSGTYGVTQGPRLETAAEIRRMAQDGCDIVGMTAMPEAVLARELDCCYASISVIANLAAGLGEGEITMAEIEKYIAEGMAEVRSLLETVMLNIQSDG